MDFCPCAFWQYPWHVSRNATSSDVCKSLDRDRLQQAQNWLHINFGRRHERRAQFIVLLFRQVSLEVVEYSSYERIAVGMRPAGSEPEDHIARYDGAAIDDAILLDHADAEPGEVVFARRIHAGHLGRLAADQRAAGEFAAARNALDDLRGDLRIEFAAGEIVEKEQRLGALYEHVVGAHRYKIDADGVVAAEGEGELQLSAHAIRARDQYGVTVFLRQLAQRAETTDSRQDFGAQRFTRVRLDRLDQRIAGVDVDPGVAVGEAFRHARVGNSNAAATSGHLAA